MTFETTTGILVTRAKDFGDSIAFDMNYNGVSMYRLTLKEGKFGKFVNFPSYEGKNGTWYKYYYVKFTKEELNEIIKQIANVL